MKKEEICFAMGNEAFAEGAIAAGARFYGGYPITPSTEIAEISAVRLPQEGGVFVQMEDEIGSICSIIGASSMGIKAYTATSGPGFSLMQQDIGVAIMAEVPIVVVNVQRNGPSTGVGTKPSQGDVMQAQFGTHGDHGIIVISPSTVQECYDLAIVAFNMAEKYRTPVIFLSDGVTGHLHETYVKRVPKEGEIINRKQPTCDPKDYKPYDFVSQYDGIAPLAPFGSKYVHRLNGSGHDFMGASCGTPENAKLFGEHYVNKIEGNKKDIIMTKEFMMDDAEYAIITFGCSTRASLQAMEDAREKGIKVGVLQLITIWPFADEIIQGVCNKVKGVIVPEMNFGQIIREIKRVNIKDIPIIGVNKVNTESIKPYEVLEVIEEVAK